MIRKGKKISSSLLYFLQASKMRRINCLEVVLATYLVEKNVGGSELFLKALVPTQIFLRCKKHPFFYLVGILNPSSTCS